MNKFEVGIIGAGVAGAFASLRLAQNQNTKTIIFDLGRPPGKRRRQLEGWLGCFPSGDGKIYQNDLKKVAELADGRKVRSADKFVLRTMEDVSPMNLVHDTSPNSLLAKRIRNRGFDLLTNDYYQWKPENIHKLSRFVSDKLKNSKNITFSFDNEVYSVTKKKNLFHIVTENGEYICEKVIFCAGRSGWRWANKIYRELGLEVNDSKSTFGVRVEIASQYLREFNRSHCTLSRGDLTIGPLSWFGSVIPEDHADLVISNFRSNENRWKSDKVSFSLLSSFNFESKGSYQTERLAKLAFLLFNDRVSKEKIKTIIKLKSQLSYLKEYSWLRDILIELNDIMPGLIDKGSYYAPNILPLPAKINLKSNLESDLDNFFVAGESAGVPGIMAAALMGVLAADGVCV